MTFTSPFFDAPNSRAIAHRGGAALWPENTIHAFQGAIELGYRQFETDLHLTSDGELVLFHDPTLDRTTGGKGALAEKSLAELRTLDAGHAFTRDGKTFPFRGKGIRIPTVDELLDLRPDLHVTLEIKPKRREVVEAVHRKIVDRRVEDRVLVACEFDVVTRWFRELAAGRVCTSPGRSRIVAFWAAAKVGLHRRVAWPFECLQVPVSYRGLTIVSAPFVRAAHECGIQVQVWTINDPGEMRRLLDLGVDAIMTDYPDRLLEVVGSG